MASTPVIGLRVNGREYRGWKSARITRGIESVSGSFAIAISDRWGEQSEPWPIVEEDECTLVMGGVPIVSGYVDSRDISYGPEDHSFAVSGRDKTGALVDCSAVLDGWEFKNTPILTLAKRICEPFGIKVDSLASLDALASVEKLSIDPGDTAFDAIERACRTAGLLPISDGRGGMTLTRAGSLRCVTELVEGQNIKLASARYECVNRFNEYRVLGQSQGKDGNSGAAVASVKGAAHDDSVRRTDRVLLVRAESGVNAEQAKKRAEWEATVRAARGYSVGVTVQGWQQGDGSLWPVNALVRIRSPLLGLDTDMLITEATYSLDDSGSTTQLSLKRPDAFNPQPTIPARGAVKGKPSKKPQAPWKELTGGASVAEPNYSDPTGLSTYIPPSGK